MFGLTEPISTVTVYEFPGVKLAYWLVKSSYVSPYEEVLLTILSPLSPGSLTSAMLTLFADV